MNFLNSFPKNAQISNFIKFRPEGFRLFHADGRTDMTKLIVAFRNFAKATKGQETVMGWVKLHNKEAQILHSATDITLIWVGRGS